MFVRIVGAGQGDSAGDLVFRTWAGLSAHALEPGGHGTQLKSQDLVSSTFHPGSREASQWLCNKNLWDLNRLDKCYFEVEKEQFMTSFIIILYLLSLLLLLKKKPTTQSS